MDAADHIDGPSLFNAAETAWTPQLPQSRRFQALVRDGVIQLPRSTGKAKDSTRPLGKQLCEPGNDEIECNATAGEASSRRRSLKVSGGLSSQRCWRSKAPRQNSGTPSSDSAKRQWVVREPCNPAADSLAEQMVAQDSSHNEHDAGDEADTDVQAANETSASPPAPAPKTVTQFFDMAADDERDDEDTFFPLTTAPFATAGA